MPVNRRKDIEMLNPTCPVQNDDLARTRLIEENVIDFCFLLCRGAQGGVFHLDRRQVRVQTDSAFWTNFLMERSEASPGSTERIRSVRHHMLSGDCPRRWVFGPLQDHRAWAGPLVEHGFLLEERWKAMDARLTAKPSVPESTAEGLTIERLANAEHLASWLRIASEALCGGRQLDRVMFEYLLARPQVHLYLARIEGVPAGTCLLYLTAETAGINVVSTAAAFRRRGIASALVGNAMRQAVLEGCETAVLQASEMAERTYQRLGFTTKGEFLVFAPAP